MASRTAWRVFLIQRAFVQAYPVAYELDGAFAAGNPMLEEVLPSLLQIKMTAILDEALEEYLASHSTPLPSKYRADLNGRICYFDDSALIQNASDLHGVRERRNAAAHESGSVVSWQQLDSDADAVHGALEHLGIVGERPRFEVVGERSKVTPSEEPGVLHTQDYAIRVIEGNKTALEFTWRSALHDDPPS